MTSDHDRFYSSFQWLIRTSWKALAGLEVQGRHNVPPSGPFLLICNHQSNLDPLIIQAVCPRIVRAMAKSSQFAVPIVGWVMRRVRSFPVRRYKIDPQAVRTTLRALGAGEGVAIYIEGERSWDGILQSPRLGTVRLILKAGVPVIPTTITGSYEAWPRWDSHIQRLPVTVTFGAPLEFPRLDRKADREAAVPSTSRRIMGTLARQIGGRTTFST